MLNVPLSLPFLTFVPGMLEAFQNNLSFLDKDASGKKFLLAVSGGLDSIVMAELFKLSAYDFSIAHCNFQLRGKESHGDEKFVEKLAAKYKVKFHSTRFETEKYCSENKVSIQMGARQLRYEWLENIRQKSKHDYLVTAHHADDAIETFFINLLRGTGISGLHGIKERNENVIRPMLHFYRKDIEKFAKKNKLKWREDSSNSTDKYERNKIRHHLLPLMEEINSKAKESIVATMENLVRTETILSDSMERIAAKYISSQEGETSIGFDFFKELNPAPAYLYEVIKKYGFNYEQCLQIVESASRQSGKMFLSENYRLVIDRKKIIIGDLIKNDTGVWEVETDDKELFTPKATYIFNTFKRTADFKIPTNPKTIALDLDKLTFPLKIRKWEKGDKFYPLGMKKPKKVSDFLIDNKVSVPDKDKTYVLISAGEIAWIIGHRPDDRFKVTTATKNLYLCSLQNAITL